MMNLTEAHWAQLRTAARLGAWVEARRQGLTAPASDRMAEAACNAVRGLIDEWGRELEEGGG